MVAYWQHWLCRKVPGGWAGAHIRVFFWKVCSYLRESFFLHKKIAKRSSWYNFLSTSREKNWSFSLKRFQILLKNLAYLGSKKELTQIWKLANTNFWQVSVSSGQKSAQKYPGFSTFSPVKSNRSWFLHSRGRRYYRNRSGIAIPKCLESVSESNLAHPWVSVSVSESNLWFGDLFRNRCLLSLVSCITGNLLALSWGQGYAINSLLQNLLINYEGLASLVLSLVDWSRAPLFRVLPENNYFHS